MSKCGFYCCCCICRHDEVVSKSTTRAPSHHCRYAFNNPMAAFFCGTGYGDGPFGVTSEEQVRTR